MVLLLKILQSSCFCYVYYIFFCSEVKVPTKKSEEVLSDIFHFRAPEAVDVIQFEAKIPLYSELGLREQGEVRFVDGKTKKIDDGKTKKIEKTFKEDEVCFGILLHK